MDLLYNIKMYSIQSFVRAVRRHIKVCNMHVAEEVTLFTLNHKWPGVHSWFEETRDYYEMHSDAIELIIFCSGIPFKVDREQGSPV